MNKQNTYFKGFTIVELLVAVAIISILAALVLVQFSNITKQANIASLKADLSTVSRQLKAFHVENDTYPNTISCSEPNSATNLCIKFSPGNILDQENGGYASTSSTYSLTVKNGGTSYRVTHNTEPGEVTPLTSIANITGTLQVNSTLTAGALSPSGVTASYQWQRCDNSNGTSCINISGATSTTYTLASNDVSKYIKVIATGIGFSWGSVASAVTDVVNPKPPIFSNGGAITTSGGYRIHTFEPGTYSITAGTSGVAEVTINGAGGSAGSPVWEDYCEFYGNGTAGGHSSVTRSGVIWLANGGGGGRSDQNYCGGTGVIYDGLHGTTNTPSGWTANNGGGATGGDKYYWGTDWEGYGGNGGNGGSLLKSDLTISNGDIFSITVGAKGQPNGNPGSVIIRYLNN